MEALLAVVVGIFGLCFGSFVTLASYRLPRGEGVVKGASRCPSCNHALGIRDLFPVFSWVVSCAQCRYCNKSVHWRYPAIELITAAAFLSLYMRFGVTWQMLVLSLFAVALLVMIVADFEHYIIPDEVHYALLPLGAVYRIFNHVPLMEITGGLGLGLGIGLALRYGYQLLKKREGLGWGDVKFLAVVGLWLGTTPIVPFLFFSGVMGVCTALIWRLLGKGAIFPFGPALAFSLYFCVVYPEVPEAFWNLQRAFYQ